MQNRVVCATMVGPILTRTRREGGGKVRELTSKVTNHVFVPMDGLTDSFYSVI